MNNSAWNYRYFLVSKRFMLSKADSEKEIDWAIAKIEEKAENEAAWNYLAGWFPFYNFFSGKNFEETQEKEKKLSFENYPKLEKACYALMTKEENTGNRFLFFFILNFYLIQRKEENLIFNVPFLP